MERSGGRKSSGGRLLCADRSGTERVGGEGYGVHQGYKRESGRGAYLLCHAILTDLDNLDYEDKHYQRRKTDLENRLSKTYDKIEEAGNSLVEAEPETQPEVELLEINL